MREYPSVSPEWGTELTRVAVSRRHTCPQLVLLGHRQARASFATATATLAAAAIAAAAAAVATASVAAASDTTAALAAATLPIAAILVTLG